MSLRGDGMCCGVGPQMLQEKQDNIRAFADKGVTVLLKVRGRENILVKPIILEYLCSAPLMYLWRATHFRADLPLSYTHTVLVILRLYNTPPNTWLYIEKKC